MIFYLTPPRARIDLTNFNECCFSRFKFFIEITEKGQYETTIEKLIPGTKMDQIGHFLLRCLCAYHPEVKDFVIGHEINLFKYRLETLSWNDRRRACKTILKQLPQLKNYKVFNSIKRYSEHPYIGELLQVTFSKICDTLLDPLIVEHLRTECNIKCRKYFEKVPFQMILTLIQDRSVELEQGIAFIPCSMWNRLLVELFNHHYKFGLSMITNSILPYLNSDIRWTVAFSQLRNTYESFKQRKVSVPSAILTAKQIDDEFQYFPPCMAHLLKMLRTHHRLSHQWRYNFSLFLKDIGLSVEESIKFWKTEYSKSCTAESSCTHSWQANYRKYVYSIRHLYGLEGSRLKKNSKSCRAFQAMALGMREEGGCPFVHFDDNHFLAALSADVVQKSEMIDEIFQLKAVNDPICACSAYRAAYAQLQGLVNPSDTFISPLSYYRGLKLCSNLSLDW